MGLKLVLHCILAASVTVSVFAGEFSLDSEMLSRGDSLLSRQPVVKLVDELCRFPVMIVGHLLSAQLPGAADQRREQPRKRRGDAAGCTRLAAAERGELTVFVLVPALQPAQAAARPFVFRPVPPFAGPPGALVALLLTLRLLFAVLPRGALPAGEVRPFSQSMRPVSPDTGRFVLREEAACLPC